MSLSRLTTQAALAPVTWAQITKTSSAAPNTPLPLAAPSATAVTLASLTSSGTTATATTSANHNLQTGDRVIIAGASLTNYNGTFVITVTGATTFTYTMPGTATSPALGATIASLVVFCKATTQSGFITTGIPITTLTQSGGVATAICPVATGLSPGDVIQVKGAQFGEYNQITTVISVLTSKSFTYAVPAGVGSPTVAAFSAITMTVPAIRAQKFLMRAAATNAADILVGPDSTASYTHVPAGTEYLWDAEQQGYDLSQFYFQSTAASQAITVAFV